MTDDEKEIRALIVRWSRAVVEKDPDAIVADYAPDAVLFDAVPPAKTVGSAAIRDAAFAFGFHRLVPGEAGHSCGSTSMRVTACFRKEREGWKVFHEHVSAPLDPMTGKVSPPPTPE